MSRNISFKFQLKTFSNETRIENPVTYKNQNDTNIYNVLADLSQMDKAEFTEPKLQFLLRCIRVYLSNSLKYIVYFFYMIKIFKLLSDKDQNFENNPTLLQ